MYKSRLFKTTLRRYGNSFYGDYAIEKDGIDIKIISEYSKVINKMIKMLNNGEMLECQI